MRFHFEYEFDLTVTDAKAFLVGLPDPEQQPDNPVLANWSNISAALLARLDGTLRSMPGVQIDAGASALTPIEENNTD